MSRTAIAAAVIVALSVTASIQAWMLLERGSPGANPAESGPRSGLDSTSDADESAATDAHDATADIPARLAAIDARLAAIEQALPAMRQGGADTGRAGIDMRPTTVSPQAAVLATRRLQSMFPDASVDQQGMMRFQMLLANVTDEERIALSAAMTQAINDGRIRLRM